MLGLDAVWLFLYRIQVLPHSCSSTVVSKVTLLRKVLVTGEKFPLASGCQTLWSVIKR